MVRLASDTETDQHEHVKREEILRKLRHVKYSIVRFRLLINGIGEVVDAGMSGVDGLRSDRLAPLNVLLEYRSASFFERFIQNFGANLPDNTH